MRTTHELEAMATDAIRVSGGACPIDLLAIDEAEAAWFRARLARRHGVRAIGIRRGTPDEALPVSERLAGRSA